LPTYAIIQHVVETADRPSPIVLSPKLLKRVDSEVQATDFDDFRTEELAFMRDRNRVLHELFGSMFEAAITGYWEDAEDEARRAATGFLFAHRLLRYGNNNLPLPHRSIEQAGVILRKTAQDTSLPGEKSVDEKMFEDRYKNHDYLIDRVNNFRFAATQLGARVLFILYGDAIGGAVNSGDESSETSTPLSHVIRKAYTEAKESDFDEFCTEELHGLMEANSPLGEHVVEAAAMYMGMYSEDEAKKFTLGVSLAHRILRYARDGQPIPLKPDDESKNIIKDALAGSKTTDPKQSKLETAFRDRFKDKPELTDFVYDVLTQPMCRYGVELLLLTYAEELDPQPILTT